MFAVLYAIVARRDLVTLTAPALRQPLATAVRLLLIEAEGILLATVLEEPLTEMAEAASREAGLPARAVAGSRSGRPHGQLAGP